jgi:hypothetical protein
VLFSPHDSVAVKVLSMILVMSSSYDCVHKCGHESVSEPLNTGWTLCEQQRELKSKCSEWKKGGGRNFLSRCFMW